MAILKNIHSVTAYAPATCANVAVGFDILGFSADVIGDYVTLTRRQDNVIVIDKIESKKKLPLDPEKNVASAVVKKICQDLNIRQGFSLQLRKGISLSSGMGGSAASAVSAIFALNAFLEQPLTNNELIKYALYGEAIACGYPHADNVVPCMMGGFTLTHSTDPLDIIHLPIPNCFYIIIHPHLEVDTKLARSVLKDELPLKDYVQQSANLAAFIAALYKDDLVFLKKALTDVLIEPRRAALVPSFYKIKNAAIEAGALGVSFSGSGPSLFAFAVDKSTAEFISDAMVRAFASENIIADAYINKISAKGARIIEIH